MSDNIHTFIMKSGFGKWKDMLIFPKLSHYNMREVIKLNNTISIKHHIYLHNNRQASYDSIFLRQ